MSVKTSCRTALLRLCAALAFVLSTTTASAYTERNLLTGRADLETLKAALVADRAWVPYPAYADRQGWADFLGEYRDDYIRRGEKRLDYEWRVVRATDYLEFERSGNRDVMESPLESNNRAIADLLLAELAEGKGRFTDQLINGVFQACEMTSWALAAHLVVQPTHRALPAYDYPVIDLVSGDMGALLSWTYYFMHEAFDRVDPEISRRLRHELQVRIMDPYVENDAFWWMGRNYRGQMLNNWNPWCNSNVLATFLLMEDDRDRLARGVRLTMESVDKFLNYIKADGGCEEGPSYWGHAAGKTLDYLELLAQATDGKVNVWDEPLVRHMGEYISRSYVGNGWVVNFADASAKGDGDAPLIYRFGKAVGSNLLIQHAAADADRDWREDDNNYSLFYKYIALSHLNEIRGEAKKHRSMEKPSFTVLRNTGIALYREKDTVFAIKGGNNGESHNHNDAGSIILYKDGCPCLIDIGVETYTKKTFSEARYTLFPMRSTYHNLVNFPPLEQHAGKMFRARILQMDERITSLDLTDAYESGNGLRKYIRTALFDREAGRITITEDFDSDKQAVLSLISTEKPEYSERSIVWSTFRADFNTVSKFSLDAISIMDKRLRKAWPETIYRTLAVLPHTAEWTISFSGGNE